MSEIYVANPLFMALKLVMKLAAKRCQSKNYEYKCTFLKKSSSKTSELFSFVRWVNIDEKEMPQKKKSKRLMSVSANRD